MMRVRMAPEAKEKQKLFLHCITSSIVSFATNVLS